MKRQIGNQLFVVAFGVLLILMILLRYIIHVTRPGTFSLVTFTVIRAGEALALAACVLLVVTERRKKYSLNVAIYAIAILAHLSWFLSRMYFQHFTPTTADYLGQLIVIGGILLLASYPIAQMKTKKSNQAL